MPTYEYLCTSCGHEWEFEQSIKDEPQKICQKCNNETARRQISKGVGFILKGGGWYSDLYSSTSNKPAKSEKSESTSEGSSDAKSSGDAKKTEGASSTTPTTPSSSGTSSSGSSSSPAAA